MIHLLHETHAKYSDNAPAQYMPDGLTKDQYYLVVAEKTSSRKQSFDQKNNKTGENEKIIKDIQDLSIGVINKQNHLVFISSKNCELHINTITQSSINSAQISKMEKTIEDMRTKIKHIDNSK